MKGKRPISVYVSSPYSKGNKLANIRRAIEAGEQLWQAGYIPFIPHLFHYWNKISPKTEKQWLSIGKIWLTQCDAVLRLEGKSKCIGLLYGNHRLLV